MQSCSQSKIKPGEPVSALELYSGFFYKIIKKARRDNEFDYNIDLRILSAEHGIIHPDTEIEWYDRRMDRARAQELAPAVQRQLKQISPEYDHIIINAGKTYRESVKGIGEEIEHEVYYITGSGIGDKGNVLKRLVRGMTDAQTDPAIIKNPSQ
ncbi:DUF6884 domain-containing protein [Natrialbaceae archaeon GCM10025896]